MPWPEYLLNYRFSGILSIHAPHLPSRLSSCSLTSWHAKFFKTVTPKYCHNYFLQLNLCAFLKCLWRQGEEQRHSLLLIQMQPYKHWFVSLDSFLNKAKSFPKSAGHSSFYLKLIEQKTNSFSAYAMFRCGLTYSCWTSECLWCQGVFFGIGLK